MRRIIRKSLSEATSGKLDELGQRVAEAESPKAMAMAAWDAKPKREFAEIRRVLAEMAQGRARCMYCEDSLGTDIEHFWPKADYPHRAFEWNNYLLACGHCNSNQKRNQFPMDAEGNPLLIDPSAEDPLMHLQFLPTTGEFEAIGPKGEPSIEVFGLNNTDPRRLPMGRVDALISFVALLRMYDQLVRNDDSVGASQTRATLLRFPFSSVLVWLLSVTDKPGARAVLPADVCDLVANHDVARWIDDDA